MLIMITRDWLNYSYPHDPDSKSNNFENMLNSNPRIIHDKRSFTQLNVEFACRLVATTRRTTQVRLKLATAAQSS
jgi:hypothetical protein